MSQKDSSSKIKASQGSGSPTPSRRSGTTRYRMQAAQAQAQQEALKAAAEQEQETKRRGPEPQERPAPPQARAQQAPAPPAPAPEAPPEAEGDDNVSGLWKSRVLASYKGKGPKDSHTLLARIPEGKASLEVSDHYKTTSVQEAMISTVDRMFDTFQNCAYEFNKIAAGTDLELNWIRPFLSKEVTNSWHQSENFVLVFSGRMSTRRWTMVVKGTSEDVQVFILPADKLIGFALSAKNFKSYFCMTPQASDMDVRWKVAGHVLGNEKFPVIFKELFDALIRFAKDEADPNEVFDLTQIGLQPQAQEAQESDEVARQQFYQQQFFDDMRSRAERSSSDLASDAPAAPSVRPQMTGAVGQDGLNRPRDAQYAPGSAQSQQLHQAPPPQPMPQAVPQPIPQPTPQPQQPMPMPKDSGSSGTWMPIDAAGNVNPDTQRQFYERMAEHVNAAGIQKPVPPVPRPTPQPQMQPPQLPPPPPQMPPQPKPAAAPPPAQQASFPVALSNMISSLDRELEIVAKAGADAFAQRDLTRADAALKFSGRLTEFRNIALELLEYYKRKP